MASITLYVAPLGRSWSVREGSAYYGEYRTQAKAREADEEMAKELRSEGHEVTIAVTARRPGGR